MKAQQKTLPDGSGAGKGWILVQQLRKENWVMDQQDTWKQQQQQRQWRGWRLGTTGPTLGKTDKNNIEPTTVNALYPTTHNTTTIFALLVTDDDDDNKTIITNNQTNKHMETS